MSSAASNKVVTGMIRQLVHQNFPPVKFIMAYGSGVFQQVGYDDLAKKTSNDLPMIDLILAVENSEEWHRQNLEQNRAHYSSLMKLCGSSVIGKVQRNWGAQIYYHPFVQLPFKRGDLQSDDIDKVHKVDSDNGIQLDNRIYKYGIIEESDLVDDLNKWNTLYVSGRLHKPCVISVENESDVELKQSLRNNLYSALKVACIMLHTSTLPPSGVWTLKDLFMTICSLSYTGDIRMQMGGYGENQNKVANIVNGNYDKFLRLYLPLIQQAPFIEMIGENAERSAELQLMQGQIISFTIKEGELRTTEDLPSNLVAHLSTTFGSVQDYQRALTQIVKQTSTSQSLKGILTAGFRKSYMYALEKVKKGAKAKKQSK